MSQPSRLANPGKKYVFLNNLPNIFSPGTNDDYFCLVPILLEYRAGENQDAVIRRRRDRCWEGRTIAFHDICALMTHPRPGTQPNNPFGFRFTF